MCKRDHKGKKTARRETLMAISGDASWLAERYAKECLRGLKGEKRLEAQEQLFSVQEDEDS